MRFAQTNWRVKRHVHPTTIIGLLLGVGVLTLVVLTFNGTIGYTVGFSVLAAVMLVKVGINLLRNALLK